MNQEDKKCLRCQGQLEEGFLVDTGGVSTGAGIKKPTDWIAGKPQRSFWGGVKIVGKRIGAVRADRCVECGTIELSVN